MIDRRSGCLAPTLLPTPCNGVTVQGSRGGQQVASQVFGFVPPVQITGVAPTANMTQGVLDSGFLNVDKVTFNTDYLLLGTLGTTLLNDLDYTVYIPK